MRILRTLLLLATASPLLAAPATNAPAPTSTTKSQPARGNSNAENNCFGNDRSLDWSVYVGEYVGWVMSSQGGANSDINRDWAERYCGRVTGPTR